MNDNTWQSFIYLTLCHDGIQFSEGKLMQVHTRMSILKCFNLFFCALAINIWNETLIKKTDFSDIVITRRLHNVSPHKMEIFVYKNTFYTCDFMLFLIAHHLLCLISVQPSFETLHFRFFNHFESHQTDLSVVHLPFIHFALLSLQSFSYKHSNKNHIKLSMHVFY